jgi:hypothetical protein
MSLCLGIEYQPAYPSIKGAIYKEHNKVNKLSQRLDLFAVCIPLKNSRVEKTTPCKKKMSKIELFKPNAKNISFGFLLNCA